MKAFSPVRSIRKNSLSDHSLGISRSKTPVDDPMSLLCNVKDCYSKLKELVPGIPQNKKMAELTLVITGALHWPQEVKQGRSNLI